MVGIFSVVLACSVFTLRKPQRRRCAISRLVKPSRKIIQRLKPLIYEDFIFLSVRPSQEREGCKRVKIRVENFGLEHIFLKHL